ncbi:SPOR domain-containing protein [Thiothrix lacustris]|uniref:SPOR domain-containing protein n=1 Tax=Thiothrix lacustris TaxID=525917 RepID=UPI0027E47B33|nr:SPOR domain-containing protein [Thiothrix lacustris]WMP17124.1 SPOR domain-containing protein [Thiothrix lacustris]
MKNRMKVGAASLTLVAFMSGCAPTPGTTTPQAGATTGGDYNSYGSNSYGTTGAATGYNTGAAANTGAASNPSYYDYSSGSASTGGTTSGYGSAPVSNSGGSYYDYNAPSSGSASNSVGGSYAVQVLASQSSGTAESMRSQMQSMGFNAVVDQVGGFYKVRVPFSSESEAKSNLGRIRSSGASDAFYTLR